MAAEDLTGPISSAFSAVVTLLQLLMVTSLASTFLLAASLLLATTLAFVKFRVLAGRKRLTGKSGQLTVAFFHPYCNAGGGGERVLWVAIRAMLARHPAAKFVVYTGDVDAAPDQIVERIRSRFNVTGISEGDVEFVYLHRRRFVEARLYPVFTLLGQSLGSVWLGMEALSHGSPDVYIDTMGYAFTLPLFKYLGGCRTASYVHYPTITTEMLDEVRARRAAHNNRGLIARSPMASYAKLVYYRLFSWMYGISGRCSDVTMVNSSWTEGHIAKLWGGADAIQKVYPPCDTAQFREMPRTSDSAMKQFRIVSLGQFRPEKDHPLQIRAMARLRDAVDEYPGRSQEEKDRLWQRLRLVLIGGCRNAEDERRVADLRNLAAHLAVDSNVEFRTNLGFEELKREMGDGIVGLHTMWNEHFGIAVVEMMAAGLVTLAHRSGGPLMDIVVETEQNRNGFLAVTEHEYAANILRIVSDLTEEGREAIRERARDSVSRFSEREFERGWIRATEPLLRIAS